jgi:hypothetical protein
MNKTVYLRDEEVPIWEKARELSGDKLSPIIVSALKRFVAEEEGRPRKFERIELRYSDARDHGFPKAKAFVGKWIIPPEQHWRHPMEALKMQPPEAMLMQKNGYALAHTAKGNVVIFQYRFSGKTDVNGVSFEVYGDFGAAAAAGGVRVQLVSDAIERLGVPVEELDI